MNPLGTRLTSRATHLTLAGAQRYRRAGSEGLLKHPCADIVTVGARKYKAQRTTFLPVPPSYVMTDLNYLSLTTRRATPIQIARRCNRVFLTESKYIYSCDQPLG
jgi:hypothetical protein